MADIPEVCPDNSPVDSTVSMNLVSSCSGRLWCLPSGGHASAPQVEPRQGSHLPRHLFFRWYQRDWLSPHQDVHEAQKYRVQTAAVLKVSGSVPGLELEVRRLFATGEHPKLSSGTGFLAGVTVSLRPALSARQRAGCCEHAAFHCVFWGRGLSPQMTLNAADSRCQILSAGLSGGC